MIYFSGFQAVRGNIVKEILTLRDYWISNILSLKYEVAKCIMIQPTRTADTELYLRTPLKRKAV
jgi:hypothetical protein